MNISPVDYGRNIKAFLQREDQQTMLPLTGTLISYTRIYASRLGFAVPTVVGLIELDGSGERVHMQMIDAVDKLSRGMKIKTVLRIMNSSEAEKQYALKAKVIHE